MWKIDPKSEKEYNYDYKGKEEGAKYRKDNSTGLWMIPESNPFKVPSVTEEDFEKGPRLKTSWNKYERKWSDFYSSDDYVKDETTNLMMAAVTAKTCREYDGFVCKVNYEV